MDQQTGAERLAQANEALRLQIVVLYEAHQEHMRQHGKMVALWEERDRIADEIGAEKQDKFTA